MRWLGAWCGVLMLAAVPALAADPPKPTEATVSCVIWQECAPIGVPVEISDRVFNAAPGHEYEVRYQYRIHTKKGESGPVLGNSDRPEGAAFTLAKSKDGKFDRLDLVDVTRADLSKMSSIPYPPKGEIRHTVFLHVECHVHDITTKTLLTAVGPDAGILVLEVNRSGKVESVRSLAGWFGETQRSPNLRDDASRRFAELDAYSVQDNSIARFYNDQFFSYLTNEKDRDRDAAALISIIRVMPRMDVVSKESSAAMQRLGELAKTAEPDVKAAAQKKLDELYAAEKK